MNTYSRLRRSVPLLTTGAVLGVLVLGCGGGADGASGPRVPPTLTVKSSVFSDTDNDYPTASMVRIDVEASPGGAEIVGGTVRISSVSQGYDSGAQDLTLGPAFYHWDTTGLTPASDYVVAATLTDAAGQTVTDESLTITLASNPPTVGKLVSSVDTSFPAQGMPVGVVRTYVLGSSLTTSFGRQWTHNYLMQVKETADGLVRLRNADGAASFFRPRGDGGYDAPRGDHRTLIKQRDGSFRLSEKSGVTYTFDSSGALNTLSDRNGNTVTLRYDTDGRLSSVVDASEQITTFAYDGSGRITSITDPAGRSVSYEYDAVNNLSGFTDIGGFRTSYAYQPGNKLSTITDPSGRQTFFETDAEDRLASVYNRGGANRVTFQYESPAANQVTVTDALGSDTVLTYDQHSAVTAIQDAAGNLTRIAYDEDGNPLDLVDASGNTTTLTYDDRGNVLSITDATGNTRTLSYDSALDKITSLTDAKGRKTTFAYDARGNLTTMTYPNGASESFAYDDFGNLAQKTDRKKQTIAYEYDGNGRLTAKRFPDGTADIFVYDERSNLVSATDANGTIGLTYDNADRLIQVAYPGGETVAYAYDAAGNRTRLIYPNGMTLDYRYDEIGRLASIENGDVIVAAYQYDALGRRLRRELQNGIYSTYAYDAVGNLEELINRKSSSEVISRFAYTYDSLGNRTNMSTLEGTTQYIYDAISQLTKVTLPTDVVTAYNLDEEGNRVSVTEDGGTTSYSTNVLNQYTNVGNDRYAYDANGNLIEKSSPSGVTTYDYDFENRLVQVITPSQTVSYAYDPFGRRTTKASPAGFTSYVYDGLNILIEKNGLGTVDAHYIHGASIDEILVMRRGGEDYFYSHDGLGTVTNLTNRSEIIVESLTYSAYGEPSKPSSIGNPYLYTGREYESETGLYYFRTRYYDPAIGRFISADPAKFMGGTNPYPYVGNNPLNWIDPLGLRRSNSLKNLLISAVVFGVVAIAFLLSPTVTIPAALVYGVLGGSVVASILQFIDFGKDYSEYVGDTIKQGANLLPDNAGVNVWGSAGDSNTGDSLPPSEDEFNLAIKPVSATSSDPTFVQIGKSRSRYRSYDSQSRNQKNLVAQIVIPYSDALVRASVPVFGKASGQQFMRYRVEFGKGHNPTDWTLITTSTASQTKDVTPIDLDDSLDITIHGNLATWDTGLTNYVYLPSHPKDHPVDLNGTYTVRLVVTGKDGTEVEDRVTVTVANVIPNAWGGLVRSKDDQAVLTVPEQAIMDSFRLISIQPTMDAPDISIGGLEFVERVFEVREPGERFTKEADLRLSFNPAELNGVDQARVGIYGYDADARTWEYLPSTRREGEDAVFTRLRKLHPYYALMTSGTPAEGSTLEQPITDVKPQLVKASANSASGPYLIRNTFEEGLGEWSNRDNEVGAEVGLDDSATFDGSRALRITNTNSGGNFAVNMVSTPFDARDYPTVQFDYRVPQGVKTNLLVKVSGRWYEVGFTDDPKELAGKRVNIAHIGDISDVRTDDAWHTARFNLYDMLRTKTGNRVVEQMIMADWDVGGFMKLQFGHNNQGATYYIDNFSIIREHQAGLILDDASLLVDHFNQMKESNALGGHTEVFTDGRAGTIETGFSDESATVTGYALLLNYDVSGTGGFAGYVSSLGRLDLRGYQTLSLRVKGEAPEQDLWVGLKDAAGNESKVSLRMLQSGRFPTAWQQVEIPLVMFTGIEDWSRIENLSLSFENDVRNRGMVSVDDLVLHKSLTRLLVDDFQQPGERNALGRKHTQVASGAVAINGAHRYSSPNGIYRLSYGGNIGDIKAYASELFSFARWQSDLGGVDCTRCGTVSFRIRGAEGGEKPNIYLDDGNFRWGVDIEDYADVTTDWQTVTIPLSAFEEYGVDLTHLAEFQVVFEWERMSGTVYLDDIRFGASVN